MKVPFLSLVILILSAALAAGEGRPGRIAFNRDVRPILSDNCFSCHGPDASHRKADLRLDTEAGAREDLGGRRAVVPGKPGDSELIARITRQGKAGHMPPLTSGKKLTPAQIALLRQWIEEGAVYENHWSQMTPRRPEIPAVKASSWPRNDIDRFILARIESAGLKPAPEADRITLIRRLSFDLLGLPPTVAEVEAFVKDKRSDAYERLVDRLLASPPHGERLAMFWLDLVRYADTVGYHGDQEHHISPYRDYVIKAFKDNMPFDRFTLEQLAGDLLPNATVDQKIASGYNRLLQTSHEGGVQIQEYLKKYDADRVRNVSMVWLGFTIGCTECHNHKFDPITQKDFYSLAAFFADLDDLKSFRGKDISPTVREPEMVVLSPLDREEAERLEAQARASTDPRQAESLKAKAEAIRKQTRRTMISVAVKPREVRILKRGDWMDKTGPLVEPAVPEFLGKLAVKGRPTRLDLARWLTSADNPATARVFVNRLWNLFFGAGLCRTLDDVGSQGEWPTHPELLDWLGVEFVKSGWNVRHLIRLMVTSSAYRQSSLEPPELRRRDPDNRLLARQGRWRLPAEMIRDNALAVSGLLVTRLGGPPARPYQPDGYYAHLNFPKRTYRADTGEGQYRRGVYVHWQRQYLHPMLKAFDAPSREECTAKRPISNTPLAALTLLNDPSSVEAARGLAIRTLREAGKEEAERLSWMWQTVLSRRPSDRELAVLAQLYRDSLADFRADPAGAAKLLAIGLLPVPKDMDTVDLAAWAEVARTLLNLSETISRN